MPDNDDMKKKIAECEESNKDNDDIVEQDKIPMHPYVNEKVKYYMLAFVVLLCIITAMLIFHGKNAEAYESTVLSAARMFYIGS